MANKSFLTSTELDFDSLKDSLKAYMQGQNQFKDYDFEGSNLSTLLDVLTYNTYLSSLYLNQVGSEMFLDTAVLRDSLVSHSKELNYIPTSKISAQANVNIVVNTGLTSASTLSGLNSFLTIPKYFEVATTVESNSYIFSTNDQHVITSPTLDADGYYRFYANNVVVLEGEIIEEVYVANTTSNVAIRYMINNANVDTTSVAVNVQTSIDDSSNNDYVFTTTMLNQTATSKIFFIQAAEDYKYEVVFGNGVVGKEIENGNIIRIKYRNCNGTEPNSANVFSTSADLDADGGLSLPTDNVMVVVNTKAELGAEEESTNSIKFNAPRFFSSQDRAVTAEDYKALISSQYPQYQAVQVFGGEDASPAQYGKVVVAIKPSDERTELTAAEKTSISAFLKPKTPLSIDPIIQDPVFNKLKVTTTVNYNTVTTAKTTNDINTLVVSALNTFNSDNLGSFGSDLRYSKLIAAIDAADNSIISNETDIKIFREIVPSSVGVINAQTIFLENELDDDEDEKTITSSQFVFGSNGYTCTFEDDGAGNINIVSIQSTGKIIVASNVGSVVYTTGTITLDRIVVTSFSGTAIQIFALPEKKDLTSSTDKILQFDSAQYDITVDGISE